jgi:hypothetical protein
MSIGFIMSGCGDDTESVAVEQVGTGDAVIVTDDDAQTATEADEGSADSGAAETDEDVVDPVVPESEPANSEDPGDPTEDPSGEESSFYNFEPWNIPAHSQDEDDNR